MNSNVAIVFRLGQPIDVRLYNYIKLARQFFDWAVKGVITRLKLY